MGAARDPFWGDTPVATTRHRPSRMLALALSGAVLACLTAGTAHASSPPSGKHVTTPLRAEAPAATSAAAPGASARQALAQAATTGKPVPVPGMTAATEDVTADPSGYFTLHDYARPAYVQQGQTWVPIDPTLHADADGTISPNAIPGGLELSGGGLGPLAVLHSQDLTGDRLSITWPQPLPAPTLSGATATYADVLPGVDLELTADSEGGIVRSPGRQQRDRRRQPGTLNADFRIPDHRRHPQRRHPRQSGGRQQPGTTRLRRSHAHDVGLDNRLEP